MIFDYKCDRCGELTDNQKMDSFTCDCKGTFRLISGTHISMPFNSGWCNTLKCEVTSWKDQEKKAREHRSRSHPMGFSMIQDNKKWMRELKHIRKHKGDYLKSELPGFKTKDIEKKYHADKPDIHNNPKSYSYSK